MEWLIPILLPAGPHNFADWYEHAFLEVKFNYFQEVLYYLVNLANQFLFGLY